MLREVREEGLYFLQTRPYDVKLHADWVFECAFLTASELSNLRLGAELTVLYIEDGLQDEESIRELA